MFDDLLESRSKRQRSWRQVLVSAVVHVGLVFAAVKATQGVAEVARPQPFDHTTVFLRSSPPAPSRAAASSAPSGGRAALPAPSKRFTPVVPPINLSIDIPPVRIDDRPFEPGAYAGPGDASGSGRGLGPIGGEGWSDGNRIGGGDAGTPYGTDELDDRVSSISIPEPRYPPALRSLGIEGTVDLQYVVDTAGRAEPNSFLVLSQSRPEFIGPAKEAILKGVFKPGRLRGRPVRQWVTQRVQFTIQR